MTTAANSSVGAPPFAWFFSAMSWFATTYGRRISS